MPWRCSRLKSVARPKPPARASILFASLLPCVSRSECPVGRSSWLTLTHLPFHLAIHQNPTIFSVLLFRTWRCSARAFSTCQVLRHLAAPKDSSPRSALIRGWFNLEESVGIGQDRGGVSNGRVCHARSAFQDQWARLKRHDDKSRGYATRISFLFTNSLMPSSESSRRSRSSSRRRTEGPVRSRSLG